jgi:hypothetical protein
VDFISRRAPGWNVPVISTPNHRANSPVSVRARHTRARGARINIRFSILLISATVISNLLVAYYPSGVPKATKILHFFLLVLSMNPYASFLGTRNPHEVIAATAARLRALLQTLGGEGANRVPAPGKWSAREILCHLADCEIVFAFRLRQALAEPNHVIQPFDQDQWSKPYASLEAGAALDVFSAVRRWNLALLETASPEDFVKRLSHPERGEMTFQTVVETMGGHDLNHLGQIETIANQLPR